MSQRVVITGLGSINPLGNNVTDYINAIKHGHCGIDFISSFDAGGYSSKLRLKSHLLTLVIFLTQKKLEGPVALLSLH